MSTQPGCSNALVTLVSRIKQSANAAGVSSVRDMALASGVSKSGVDKIYRLRSFPTFDTLLAMANAVGATVHDWTRDLEQDKESKGKRPEKRTKQDKAPPKEKAEGNQDKAKDKAPPKTEKAKAESSKAEDATKDKTKVDLMAMLHGMKPE